MSEDDLPVKTGLDKIVEPKCHCCTHPQRNAIDRMLAVQMSYSEIERLFNVDRRSASNHAKNHLNYEDAAVRQIIEEEARITSENTDAGISNSLKRRVYIDIAIDKALAALMDGDLTVEPKDAAKLIELREKLDKEHQGAAVDTIMIQHNAFKQAVLELAPPDLKWNILERTKEILDAQGAIQQAALTQGEDGTIETN